MQLNDLLKEIYLDGEIPVELLMKYGLEGVLDTVVQKVNKVLENPPVTSTRLIGLAPAIIISINSNLKEIPKGRDRDDLQYLAAEVANHLFKCVIEKSDQPIAAVRDIKISLEDASEINNYNLDDLLKHIKYSEFEETAQKIDKSSREIFWYEWLGKNKQLNLLASKLQRQNIIKSVKEFKKLFVSHSGSQKVRFLKGSEIFLIALFDELKDGDLISTKGSNGHFHPLKLYGTDFEGNILMKIDPKSIKNIAKRNVENWQRIKNHAKSIVLELQSSVTSKLPLVNSGRTKGTLL